MRTFLLTALTLIAFASNSLLTRGALGHGLIDPPMFTLIRLATGSLALIFLARVNAGLGRSAAPDTDLNGAAERGSWRSALTLAGYAVGFTLAYARIGASVGALLLFGAVQATMITAGILGGERPLRRDWAGLLLATCGLAWLTLPGVTAPDPIGACLMIGAGACWGAYSIAGRRSRAPLASTRGNFWRATVLAAIALGALASPSSATTRGVVLATISGALASGLGYTLWYSALPALGAWRAALVQLAVPILTALGAVLWLGEPVTARLVVAATLVAAGVAGTLRTPQPTAR